MGKHLRFAGRGLLFIFILSLCIGNANAVFVEKKKGARYATTVTYNKFYQMEENTVDVLFLGTSHAMNAYIPQELYERYGIRGYNLGCPYQSMITSYFWLKEALRRQSPEAVVLDMFYVYKFHENVVNEPESGIREAFDPMKLSPVKVEAIHTICKIDDTMGSVLSYYLPLLRFHKRWKGLTEKDFWEKDRGGYRDMKGCHILKQSCGIQDYLPFEADKTVGEADMDPIMQEYLDRVEELCRQKGITLVLTQTPLNDIGVAEKQRRYNTVSRYAAEHDLLYLDFNEKTLYEKIGYDFEKDNANSGHVNLWGAQKVTDYIGQILAERCGLEGRDDAQYEQAREAYKEMEKDMSLTRINELDSYLEALRDDRYSVFISVKDDCTQNLKSSMLERLRALGLKAELEGKYRSSYYAVVSGGTVKERQGDQRLEYGGSIRGGRTPYRIVSAGMKSGNTSSIQIDGKEYGKNRRGLNIVVYNNEMMEVLDSVCFDTSDKEDLALGQR